MAEFDFTYRSKNLKNGSEEWKTKHIKLELPKGSEYGSYNVLDTESTGGGISFIEAMKSTKEYEVKIENFKISGMNDADGRTYILKNLLKYTERKLTSEDPFIGSLVAERTFNIE